MVATLAITITIGIGIIMIGYLGKTALTNGGFIEVEGNHADSQLKITVSGNDPSVKDKSDAMGKLISK